MSDKMFFKFLPRLENKITFFTVDFGNPVISFFHIDFLQMMLIKILMKTTT